MKRMWLIVLFLTVGGWMYAAEDSNEKTEVKTEVKTEEKNVEKTAEKPKETFEEYVERMLKEKYELGCIIVIRLFTKDNTTPLEVAVDRSERFSENNLKQLEDFASHYGYWREISWYSYILIPKSGTYCFSAKINETENKKSKRIYIDVKDKTGKWQSFYVGLNLPKKSQREGGTDAGTMRVDLRAGFIPMGVTFCLADNWEDCQFTLQYWNVEKPMERKTITPATLYYLKRLKGE